MKDRSGDLGDDAVKLMSLLMVVMEHDGVDRSEAVRRLVAYGEVVYRTLRLEQGQVLLRSRSGVERAVVIDEGGNPVERDAAPLMWMRPEWSRVACGFLGAEVAAGLDPLEPIARCDRWAVTDLVQDDAAQRCPACLRTAKRWSAR